MSEELVLEYLGRDYWDRLVYKDINTGRYYKHYEEHSMHVITLYTTSEFEGEPGWPVEKPFRIIKD